MAGIPNQPTPKPKDLKSPVPGNDPFAELDAIDPSAYAELDALDAGAQQAQQAPEQGIGQRVAQATADWAPTALGIAGGVVGTAFGPVGTVGGAVLGGAAGQGYREFIETQILGKEAPTLEQSLTNVGKSAVIEGAGQAVGLGAAKVGGKAIGALAKTKAGAAVADLAEAPLKYVKDSIQSVRNEIQEPVLKFIAERTTKLNSEQSGEAVKQLLKQNIQSKYGPFVQAYADLDSVAKAMPLADESRRGFTVKLKNWALENLSGDNYKTIQKFANDFDASNFGKQFDDVIGQISDARQVALQTGATKQAAILKELQNRAEDFMEGETTKLAARVQAGKAAPQEMQFLSEVARTRGVQEQDPAKYAKSLAKDYLTSKEKVKSDYAGFRSFLENVGEQTKVKTNKRGPMRFLDEVDDIPPEKLVERMFDPKNAGALRRMQKETPEVFDQVSRAKVNQLIQKASPTGELDLVALQKEVNKLPEATRYILFKPEEVKTLAKINNNPRLARLQSLEKMGENSIIKLVGNIVEASRIAGGKVASGVKNTPAVRVPLQRAVGGAVVDKVKSKYQQPTEE